MKRLLSAVAIASATLVAALPASAAVVVSFTPSSSHVAIGDTVDIQMVIAGLGDEILSAFDINLLFDGAIASNTSVLFSGEAELGGAADTYFASTFGAGVTNVVGGSWLDDGDLLGQANSFALVTFTMKGEANGKTTLQLGADPDYERNFVGLRFQSLAVQAGTACLAVGTGSCDNGGTVPEPAGYGLAGLALMAAGWAGRRRKSV